MKSSLRAANRRRSSIVEATTLERRLRKVGGWWRIELPDGDFSYALTREKAEQVLREHEANAGKIAKISLQDLRNALKG
jgi:hypothetical protein